LACSPRLLSGGFDDPSSASSQATVLLNQKFGGRGILVPAFMRAFGEHSWYAPPVLRRLHDRIGITENDLARMPPALGRPGNSVARSL
jgi:hypothetical protein